MEKEQKSSLIKWVLVAALLVMTLPLTYMLVAHIVLPMVWDEPQFTEPKE